VKGWREEGFGKVRTGRYHAMIGGHRCMVRLDLGDAPMDRPRGWRAIVHLPSGDVERRDLKTCELAQHWCSEIARGYDPDKPRPKS
jgi:hypothetical protein